MEGYLKLNFDGASRGNPGFSGTRVVIRDHKGLLVSTISIKLPKGTNNVVEAQALLHGLQLAYDLKLKDLEIEGDSLINVNVCKERKISCWKLNYVMQQVWKLMEKFRSV